NDLWPPSPPFERLSLCLFACELLSATEVSPLLRAHFRQGLTRPFRNRELVKKWGQAPADALNPPRLARYGRSQSLFFHKLWPLCESWCVPALFQHIAKGKKLLVHFSDETVVVRIVAQLHPAEPVVVRRNRVLGRDFEPGVLLGIVTEHARRVL